MPNTISFLPSSVYKVTNDPTATIAGNVPSDISANPYAEMTDELLFGAINMLLQDIDDATGLDLLGMVSPLEALLGADGGLLSGLVGFLNPSSSTVGGGVFGPLLGLIPGLGSSTGTLGGLGSFLNPTTLTSALGGVLAPLLSGSTLFGSLIPGIDASKIISGTLGPSIVQPLIDAVSQGFGGTTGLGFGGLLSFLNGLSLGGGSGISFDDLIALIPGIGTGLTGSTGLGSIFTDITGILGSPTGLGTGTTVLPGIGSIPLLGGLLSGGNLLGSLIPGLDASKIISGLFPISQITNLSTLLGGFGTSTSILTQLIGVIPGLTGGLTGLGGLGSIFTDLTHILGSPTALGSGTPVLPGIGSIPVLGGLLSGGSILGSLIPGLDASKITSGTFTLTQLPATVLNSVTGVASSLLSGVLGLGLIPSLPGSQIGSGTVASSFLPSTAWFASIPSSLLSGVLGAGLIPSLDGSKIGSGTVASSFLPSTAWFSSIAASLISGVLGTGNIPSLPASQIGSGTFLASLIPSLDGSVIGSGTVASGFLPSTAWFASIPSSLLSGVLGTGLIPSLDGSKIGSGTVASTFLPSTAWFSSIASSLLSGTIASGLIPSIDGSKIGSGTVGSSFLPSTSWFSSIPASSLTGTITETVTGLNTLRDSITKGLFGSASGSGYANTDAQNASAQTATVAAQALAAANAANATLAAQQASTNSNQGSGGINVNIVPSGADGATLSATQFVSTGPTSGNMCIRGANGYVGIAAGVATNSTVYGIINATYATQNQSISISLGDQGSYNGAGTMILTHCNTTLTLGAYCHIANDTIVIGSFTRSGATFTLTPFTGGTWSGNVSGRVEFRNIGTTWFILVNGSQVLTCTNATVTLTNFTPGIAMERAHSSGGFFGWGSGDYDSYRAAAVAVADYVQPTFVGSGARIFRASATQLTPTYTLNTNVALPVNFWDNLDKNSADITVNLSAGSFTVANAGWYDVSCRYVCVPGSMTGQFSVCPILIVGGGTAAVEYGPNYIGGLASSTDAIRFPLYSIAGSFKVYLAANSVVSVGYRHEGVAGNVWKILGGSSQACYFDIQLDNKSLA